MPSTALKLVAANALKRSTTPKYAAGTILIGYNFRNHAQEIARLRGESDKSAEVADPIYFSKRTAYSTGPNAPIPFVPGYAENLDCGVEVAAVIGRDALNITPEEAGDYIFGYTIANDVCDTRLNKAYTQPFLGKSVDGYMPTGPWIVTADEFAREPYFDLRLTVNGTLRQTGNTRDLVFGIPFIVSQLSRNMTLKAGTMISTGSPANLDAGHPDNMAAGPASYGMTDTMGRMHSDAQFAGSSSVPAHVEMMGFLGMGNNPMVGATVAVAVAVDEALNK